MKWNVRDYMAVFVAILIALVWCTISLAGCATPTAKDYAGFYGNNYPNQTSNQRAEALMNSMDYMKMPYTTSTKVYKVKVIHVYNGAGKQIYPDPDIKRTREY